MKYKIFISDYDMTLGIRPNIISKNNINAIKKYQRKGGIFVLCTGRMLRSAKQILVENDIDCDIIAYQGSLIENRQGEIILDGGIDCKTSAEFLRMAENNGEHLNIFVDDTHYTNMLNDKTDFYEFSSRMKVNLLDGKLSDYVEKNKCICRKMAIMTAHDEVNKKREIYSKYFPTLEINSGGYYLTEIVDKKYNKGNAVKVIAEKYGVSLDEVIAIGDSTNDMSMVETAGLGIAVGDGTEELKSVAKVIAPPFNEDAVANMLEKYCNI